MPHQPTEGEGTNDLRLRLASNTSNIRSTWVTVDHFPHDAKCLQRNGDLRWTGSGTTARISLSLPLKPDASHAPRERRTKKRVPLGTKTPHRDPDTARRNQRTSQHRQGKSKASITPFQDLVLTGGGSSSPSFPFSRRAAEHESTPWPPPVVSNHQIETTKKKGKRMEGRPGVGSWRIKDRLRWNGVRENRASGVEQHSPPLTAGITRVHECSKARRER